MFRQPFCSQFFHSFYTQRDPPLKSQSSGHRGIGAHVSRPLPCRAMHPPSPSQCTSGQPSPSPSITPQLYDRVVSLFASPSCASINSCSRASEAMAPATAAGAGRARRRRERQRPLLMADTTSEPGGMAVGGSDISNLLPRLSVQAGGVELGNG